mmetsp:Transcript_20679/g.62322  ORF Transcript_20679/g.62322 Transcript_20679/m.62322 type:complete len:228 (+) Transcript_20679:394-1077(+)
MAGSTSRPKGTMLSSDRIIVRRCFRATKQAFVFECLLVRFNGGGQIRQRLLRFGAEGEGRQCRLGGSLCRDSPLSIARIRSGIVQSKRDTQPSVHAVDGHVRPQVGIQQQPQVAPLPHHDARTPGARDIHTGLAPAALAPGSVAKLKQCAIAGPHGALALLARHHILLRFRVRGRLRIPRCCCRPAGHGGLGAKDALRSRDVCASCAGGAAKGAAEHCRLGPKPLPV